MSTVVAVRRNPPLRDFYQLLRRAGKLPKVASSSEVFKKVRRIADADTRKFPQSSFELTEERLNIGISETIDFAVSSSALTQEISPLIPSFTEG